MKRLLMCFLVLISGQVLANDGCSATQGQCVNMHQGQFYGQELVVHLKNNCSKRVYVKLCMDRDAGEISCGSFGILPGDINSFSSFDVNGDISWKWVGSAREAGDLNCALRTGQWKLKTIR